jgi:Ca2+-binding EF-hand superfamily protein
MWDDSIHMRNGEFIMFCREFGIQISRERAVAIFNKISDFRKPINFTQFVQLLDLLAVTLNEIKID